MKKKILGAVIAFVFTLGVSIGVTSSINFKVANADNVKTVDLPSGIYMDSKIVWDLDGLITISQNKGNSQNDVNNNYINAPRMYKGHYLRFEAVENVAITSIKITAVSKYSGQDITYISSAESNGALAYSGTDKPSVSDGYSSMESSSEMTFIFDSSRSIVIQNSYKDSSSYEQLRFSELEITYTSSIVTILPTQVIVDINKLEFTYAGETAQATAIVLPEEATNKKVTWSSSNNSVAEVDAHTGVVTAIGNGDANIIATCVADESITDFVNVQVSISQSYIEVDALLNHDTLKLITTSYASNDGTHKVGDFTFATKDVMRENVKGSERIQLKKSSGYITNEYSYFNPLKKISISGDVEPILEVGITSADTIVQSIELNGYWVYDLTSYNATVFKITASSSTTFLNHIFIETTDSDVEEIRAFAVLANETLIEECNALNVQTSTWDELAGFYNSLTEGQQKILTETEISIAYSDIQQFVQRYDYIIAKYSYSNFMNRNVNMLNVSNENINNADLLIIIVVISILSVSSIALFAISKRKAIRK